MPEERTPEADNPDDDPVLPDETKQADDRTASSEALASGSKEMAPSSKKKEAKAKKKASSASPRSALRAEVGRPALGISGLTTARMTLLSTSMIFLVTFFAWGGAKVACNLHPPKYEAFEKATVNRLIATPKGGALEFHHRLQTLDFDGARELAIGDGLPVVEREQVECDAACRGSKKAREDDALTRAIVLSREGNSAVVTAETFFEGQVDATTYRVRWDKRGWKVEGLAK